MAFLNHFSGVGTLIIVPHQGQPCALLAHEVHKTREHGRYIVDEFGGGTEPTKTLSQSAVKELIEESAGLIVPRRADFFARWRHVLDMDTLTPNKQYRLHTLYLTHLDTAPFYENMRRIRGEGQCKKVGWCETARLHHIPIQNILHLTPPKNKNHCKALLDANGQKVYVGPRFLALIRAGLPTLLRRTLRHGPTHEPIPYKKQTIQLHLNNQPYMIGGTLHKMNLTSWTLRRVKTS